MRAEIVTSDVFQGREFIGGTFTGTRFEGAEIEGAAISGGSLDIEGALRANAEDGVSVGGVLPLHENPATQTVPGATYEHSLASDLVVDSGDLIIRVKVERAEDYQYGGRLRLRVGTFRSDERRGG